MTDEKTAEEKGAKKIVIDSDLCVGCQACQDIAPEYFDASNIPAKVIKDYDEKDAALIQQAIDSCGGGAISIK